MNRQMFAFQYRFMRAYGNGCLKAVLKTCWMNLLGRPVHVYPRYWV